MMTRFVSRKESMMTRFVSMSVVIIVMIGVLENDGFAEDMKTVMFLRFSQMEFMVPRTLESLEQQGFVEHQNLTSVVLDVSAQTDPAQILARVKEVAPDILIVTVGITPILNALKGADIPTVTGGGVECCVNAGGTPTANITGTYFKLRDQDYNSYKFLQLVAPLKPGQQAILVDNPEFPVVTKEGVTDALQRLHIPLKAAVEAAILEDFQEAVLTYDDDPDVGWILIGEPPWRNRNGDPIDLYADILHWLRNHLNKPTISNVEFTVQGGMLCGFGVDTDEVSRQHGEMAARILQGEPIQSITAEYPRKVSIALNRKTADNLGIVFSLDVLDLANVIFDDYEGKQVIRK